MLSGTGKRRRILATKNKRLDWNEIITVEHRTTLPRTCPSCGQDLDDLSGMLEEIWIVPKMLKMTRIQVLSPRDDLEVSFIEGDPIRMGWRCINCNEAVAGSDIIQDASGDSCCAAG